MGPLISGKSRLVKYYNLARIFTVFMLGKVVIRRGFCEPACKKVVEEHLQKRKSRP